MRLAIVTHNVVQNDGQGKVNFETAQECLRQGMAVTLIADKVDPRILALGAEWVPLHPKVISKINLIKVLEMRMRADAFLKKRGKDFDVVQGCGYTTTVPHDINVSHFVHDAWLKSSFHPYKKSKTVKNWYQWLYSFVNARWEKKAYEAAHSVIAVSDAVRHELMAAGVPREKIKVILNGADTSKFHAGMCDRRHLGVPEGKPVGLFVGDIKSPRKNLDSVLRATKEIPEMELVVVGKTEDSPFLKMAEDLNVHQRVHFLGFRNDVADIMRCCDFFVFPSRYEACALVLAEAVASGLPVITSQTTGGSELISSNIGICIDSPDNLPQLTASIKLLVDDSAKRKAMSAAASACAPDLDWRCVAGKYADLYREVAQ